MISFEKGKIKFSYWHPLDELEEITLYPVFLQKRLASMPQVTEHIVIT
jgi:hypothetical protein